MPADAFVPDLASVPSLDAAEKYLRAGMPDDAERLACARMAEDFYQFRNAEHLMRREAETDEDFKRRPKRYSRLARTVTRKLAVLYSPGPTRAWEGGGSVETWLNDAYSAAAINTRLMSADRSATLHHAAALQVEPTGDPKRPLRYWLWKGHEFVVFLRDGDPVDPYAVCTMDTIPDPAAKGKTCTRFRLWSAAERRTLLSDPHGGAAGSGKATRAHPDPEQSGPSPYPGVLPFVFARNEPADSLFWEGGIGPALVDLNRELDRGLSDLAEHVWAFLNPYLVAKGVKASQRILLKAGVPFHLEADSSTMQGDNKVEPKLEYLQAQLAVEAAWYDLKTYADSALEELEVPLTVVRSDATTELSGVAIIAKSLPLVERTRGRQPEWTELEQALAAKSLAVAGLHYGQPALAAAAMNPRLVCTWPEPKTPLPTADQNEIDEWDLTNRMSDPIEVLARRRGITLQQAEELARAMAGRWATWEDVIGDLAEPTDSTGQTKPGAVKGAATDPPAEPPDDPAED
jgi:hypothetical protein